MEGQDPESPRMWATLSFKCGPCQRAREEKGRERRAGQQRLLLVAKPPTNWQVSARSSPHALISQVRLLYLPVNAYYQGLDPGDLG